MTVGSTFAEAFVMATVQVLKTELGSQVERSASMESSLASRGDISVLVGVTGGLRGTMVLSMSQEAARLVIGAMIGEPAGEMDEMGKSAVAELGNMIAGLATVQLEQRGFQSDITPPSVVTGQNTAISTSGTEAVVVPLSTSFGLISLHVALKEAA